MIAEANGEVIVRKVQWKRKMKCIYHFKMPAELIKALNSKKKLKDNIFLSYINLLQSSGEIE